MIRSFAPVLDSVAEAVVILDGAGRIAAATPAARALLGLPQEVRPEGDAPPELARLLPLYTPEGSELDPAQRPDLRGLQGVAVEDAPVLARPPGSLLPLTLRITARPLPGGAVVALRLGPPPAPAIAPATLRAHSLVLENMGEGVSVLDEGGVVLYANPAQERMLGYGPGELVGHRFAEHFADDAGGGPSPLAELRRARVWRGEYLGRRKDGAAIAIRAHISAVGIEGRSYWVCVQRDLTEENRLADDLRASEQRFRDFMDHSPASAWIVDRAGTYRFVSRTYMATFTKGRDVSGCDFRELFQPAVAEAYWANNEAVFRSGQPLEAVEPGLRADGSMGVYLVTKFPIRSGGEDLLGGVAVDITERRDAEEQVRRARDILHELIERTPFGVYAVDADLRITHASAGARHTFRNVVPLEGRSVEEALHRIWSEPFASEAVARFRHTLRTGEPYASPNTTEQRSDIPATESYDWKIARITMPDGRHGVVCYFYDITERTQIAAALQQSERRFREMADSAPAMIWLTDPAGVCTYISRAWVEFTGQPPAEALGLGWTDKIHPEDRDAAAAAFLKANDAQEAFSIAYRVRHADGSWRHVIDLGRPRRGPDGAYLGFIGSVADATEQHVAESHNRFLLDLDDATRALADPQEIVRTVARLLRSRLDADRCAYAETEPDEDTFNLTGDDNRGVPSIVGRYTFAQFGAEVLQAMRAGRAFVVEDSEADPRCAAVRDAYRATRIRAVVCVPLIKEGRFVAAMAVHQARPRLWQPDEIELVRLVASRSWEAIERARVQRTLRESEASLRRFIETANEGVLRVGPDDRVVFANEHQCRILGLQPGETVGMHVLDFVFPEDRPAAAARRAARRARGVGERSEMRLRARDGREVWVLQSTVVMTRDGEYDGTYSMMADITDRKRGEEALRESEGRFRAMADSAPVLIWVAGVDRLRTWFNKGWLDFTGAALADHTGDGWLQAVHPDDRDAYLAAYAAAFQSRGEFKVEYRLRHHAGAFRWVLDQGRARVAGDGAFMGYIGSCIDVTEIVRARHASERHGQELERVVAQRTADLERSNQRLRISERMAALGTLSAGLGHDMGNILMPVRVRLESLEAMPLPPEARRELEGVRELVEYLRRLAGGLRQLAVAPGRAESAAATDLVAWWRETQGVLRNAVPRGVELRARFPEDACWVAMARPALTQAIFNLVQNAGDAMKPQGGGTIEIAGACEPGRVVVSVADDGPGMTDEVRRRCMEPFFSTKSRGLSTGLGLALVYGLVREAGGAVELDSTLGQGTTFRLTLPAADPPAPARVRRVAFVEVQDPRLRAYVTAELRRFAFDVRSAPGDDAAAHVVVLDPARVDFKPQPPPPGARAPTVIRLERPLNMESLRAAIAAAAAADATADA